MAAGQSIAGESLPPPVCPTCDGPLTPNRKFCSRQCQWASMRTRPSLTCAGCGNTFVRRRRSSRDAQLYCSRPCSDAVRRKHATRGDRRRAHKAAARARRRTRNGLDQPRVCIGCSLSFVPKQPKQHYCRQTCRKRPLAPRPCRMCGNSFTPVYGERLRTYCSRRCGAKAQRLGRPKSDKRRAQRAGVAYEPVSRLTVFSRDGWRCQCCGVKTPKRLRGMLSERAPELDHRIPLAQGGPHNYANCQTACRRCNALKGGRQVLGQTDMFPNPTRGRGGREVC
jgi:5-methylcytosine-specific restriction endonuclease McrA